MQIEKLLMSCLFYSIFEMTLLRCVIFDSTMTKGMISCYRGCW